MTPDNGARTSDEEPSNRPTIIGAWSPLSLAAAALALGVVVGLTLGWISFGSSLSAASGPPVLYDERLVTSVFEDASPAVVEITVARNAPGTARSVFRLDSASGFLVDDEGHVVTNNHVVDGAQDITVQLFDGRMLKATKLGTSPADDLALLQVDPQEVESILPLPLADSNKVMTGQMAIVIGSPFRNPNSVSVGVVSGVGRSRPSALGRPMPDLIQTDAALNPGNSGGPLLNARGEVMGVNYAVAVVSSVPVGVGFAVPSNTLRDILTDLMSPGEIKRPWIGISGAPLTKSMSEFLNIPTESGIYVHEVWSGSPAQEARLRGDPLRAPTGQGDVIVAVDGIPVGSVSDMVSYLNTRRPGDHVTLTILRDKKAQEVDISLAEWPDTLG